jgi:hypothetical protein
MVGLWVMTPCVPVDCYQRFEGIYYPHLQDEKEGDGGDKLTRIDGNHFAGHMTSQHRTPPLWKTS